MTQLTIQEQLKARALKDPTFRQAVLDDAKKVLADEYHVQLPDAITVHVFEESANTLSIVLPCPQAEEAVQELADSDLEAASGGSVYTSYPTYRLCFPD